MSELPDVDVEKLEPFGAEVDLDLNDPRYEGALRDLFTTHPLLVFRNQKVSVDDHKRVMGYLGPVCEHWSTLGYVSNRRKDGVLGNAEVSFHYDNSYTSDPLLGISLHALEVPYEATSTRFANGVVALAALPPALRDRVEQLKGINVFASNEEAQADRQLLDDYPDDCPRYEHPLVMTDPISGAKTLFVSQMQTAAVAGLGHDESESLLAELHTYLYDPTNVQVHRWRNGDFVIWSNFRLQHARGALDPNHERTLQRICISNGAPEVYESAIPARVVKNRIGVGTPESNVTM